MSAKADEPTAISSSAASTFGISTLQILGNQVSLQQLTPVGPIAFWGGLRQRIWYERRSYFHYHYIEPSNYPYNFSFFTKFNIA